MVNDTTEEVRRILTQAINSKRAERAELEKSHGQVWDTQQLQEDFSVKGFAAPFVIATRKSDGKVGSLLFQHDPRFYWGFAADDGTSER